MDARERANDVLIASLSYPSGARAPNGLIYLYYVGAVVLAGGVLVLGIGLVRRSAHDLE